MKLLYPMNFPYQSKRIFYRHYPAANGCLPLMLLLGFTQMEIEKNGTREVSFPELIEDYGNLSECLSDIRTVPAFSSE